MQMVGCRRSASPAERSLFVDIERMSDCLCDETFDARIFGTSLGQRMAQLQDQDAEGRSLLKFKEAVRSFAVTATNFSGRLRQLTALRSMLGWAGDGIRNSGGTEELVWEMRILGIEAMQKEIAWANSGNAKDECHRLTQGPILIATVKPAKSYLRSLQGDYDLAVRGLEKSFNDNVSKELPEERVSSMRARFEKAIGRPIRTNEEIRRDRERKIEKAREEALRRQEEKRGNDVRVDIESL